MIHKINTVQSSWKATAYNDWEQYTIEQVMKRLGGIRSRIHWRPRNLGSEVSEETQRLANQLPDSFDWRNVNGRNFVSPVRDQGGCGSCYAFASMAMLEARYRIMTNGTEQLVFSPQDIVECSEYAQG